MDFLPLLGAIDGQQLMHTLLAVVIWGVVFYVCWWGLGKIGLPEPWNKVATLLLVILTVVILLNLFMGLVAEPFIKW